MRYIVTGGAGFIGSHLVEMLSKEGHDVLVIDNFSSGKLENIPNDVPRICWELDELSDSYFTDIGILENAGNGKFDGVFHLAADARIQPTIKDPRHAVLANIVATMNILEIMRYAKIPNIVYSASSSTYGLKNKSPLREDMHPDCLNPYAVTKYAGEQLCQTWGKCYGIGNVSLKYFNVYGERSPVQLGKYSPVIGLFFKQALRDNKNLTVVGDGNQKRDFTYVSDVARANILAMQNLEGSGKANGHTINIGTGTNHTINDIAKKVCDLVKPIRPKIKVSHVSPRPAEARETLADNSKAKQLLGWEPTVGLDEALQKLLPYYQEQFA